MAVCILVMLRPDVNGTVGSLTRGAKRLEKRRLKRYHDGVASKFLIFSIVNISAR
jgi:hypothetical protein